MDDSAGTDLNNMENQFCEDCEGLRKSEISEERINALLNLWETFHDGYKANSLREADRCLECLLICTAQLAFNVNYSKKISADSKKKLKGAIISCGTVMQDCTHRQKLLNGIGSIIENPWQAASFNNAVAGPKSKKEEASIKLWDTEGWIMLESRIDYLSKIGQKCIDRVCSVLHVLVEKGHEIFRKNGSKPIPFHPYEFPYHKYIEYLEVYALLYYSKLVDTQIVDAWEPQVLLEVVSSLVKKDPSCTRLFPKLKQWKDAGEAGTYFAKKATWRALKLPNGPLLKEFFSIWMEMSGFVDNGTEQSEAESPIDEIIKEEISCTENLYQIADVSIKLMGETSFTRLKYIELFVLAMTKDMTVIEALKRTQPDLKSTIKEQEERLSIRYLDLTRFFKDYRKTAKDCLITAFSLYPCQKLFTFLFPSTLADTENVDIAISEDIRVIPAEYDDIKEMELENCDLKLEEELDLGDGAADDLATLIHNPRYKGFVTLNSNEELKKVCLKLLDSKSVAVIENRTLDYVKVDYDKYKDLKSRYDPDDDGIEQGYRQGDKRNKRILQLSKRNVFSGTLKKAKKIAIQRARKLPTDGSEGIRRKGRPPKSSSLGDGYLSSANNRNSRDDFSRTIPNLSLSQNPWFPQGAVGGFYTEFFHTCIRASDPPIKEKSYGRNINHEQCLIESVKRCLLNESAVTRSQTPGGATDSNISQANVSADSGMASQNTESTTSGDVRNNHSNISNSSGQSSNESNTQMSNVPNGNPFFDDPFGGPLRKLVYQYTVMNAPSFAEREQSSGSNLPNTQLSNEQVPQAVKISKKRRNISTVSEESVTVKKPRRGPPKRSINVQSLSDTEEPLEKDSLSNKNDEEIPLEQSHLESSAKETGVGDLSLPDGNALKEQELISESTPDQEPEIIPEIIEPVFAGPFQIMTTAKTPNIPIPGVVIIPEKNKVPIPDLTSSLLNIRPVESLSVQKPLKTYSSNKGGKRRLVITTRLWPNSDDKQLEAYKSAIPVVAADVDKNSAKLNLPCTSYQADLSVTSSGSFVLPSANSSLRADVSSCSENNSQKTMTQEVPEHPLLTTTSKPFVETSIIKDDMVIKNQLPLGNLSDSNDLNGVESGEASSSQNNNGGVGTTPSSELEVVVCVSGPSIDGVKQVSNKNSQVGASVENENVEVYAKRVTGPDVTSCQKITELISLTRTEVHDKASTNPPDKISQHQNEVPNKDIFGKGPLKLEEPKKLVSEDSKPANINSNPQKAIAPFGKLLHLSSLLSKTHRSVSSDISLQDSSPRPESSRKKLVNPEIILESTENPEDTSTVKTPEIPPSSSFTVVSNDHDYETSYSDILPASNNSASTTTSMVPSSSIPFFKDSDHQHEKSGIPLSKDTSSLSTKDQIISGKTVPEISVLTPLIEKSDKSDNLLSENLTGSFPVVASNDLCMVDAKDVMYQLIEMVEQKENKSTSTAEKSLQENDSTLGESISDLSLPKKGIQAEALEKETETGSNCSVKSQVEVSAKLTSIKLIESAVGTPSGNTPSTDELFKENPETETQEINLKSQGTPEKSHVDPEIICLDSEDDYECNETENDCLQDNTVESDDDVECDSEIAQLNSTLLPHDAFPGESNQKGEGDSKVSSENLRPLTPVELLEKIINDKLRRKAKRPYDEEEDRIKVGRSVINHAIHYKTRLRSLVACCVTLDRLPELEERVRSQLEIPVKRSTRLKKKKMRTLDNVMKVFEHPNTEQGMESDSSEPDSDIEIIGEICKPNNSNKTPAAAPNMQPKTQRGMPESRKRKFNNLPKQQTVHGSKILKICSTHSNDSGVSGGNGSDGQSGSSTEVEDDDLEPGASSTCKNFPAEVYPEINCNLLSPDAIDVDDPVDPLAINDIDGRTYDQGDEGINSEPEYMVGSQVAVDEHMSNLQPEFSKSVNGNAEVDLLVEETKQVEDPSCQDVAKENFTYESSGSDCEIIEDDDSSQSVGIPSQIPSSKETPRLSCSFPTSATSTNLEKKLTRSNEHLNSRPTRLTTDKSQFYQNSVLSLDENSILDANPNTEDTDYLILSTNHESTKEAQSAECTILNDDLQNKDEDEDISGSMYILPDENIEGSSNNGESSDSNKSMQVSTLQSTDYPTTSQTILSDNGQDDSFVELIDQQISHDLENDILISSPQVTTVPEQDTCKALDASSQEEDVATPVVDQFMEMVTEEGCGSVASADDDVVVIDVAENSPPIPSPPKETIPEQESCDKLYLPSEQVTRAEPVFDLANIIPGDENAEDPEVNLSVEEVKEDSISLSDSDDDIVLLDMDSGTSKEALPKQNSYEQLSLPSEQDNLTDSRDSLSVEEESEEDHVLVPASEDEVVPDITTTSESIRVEPDQCEYERDGFPPSAAILPDQISEDVLTCFDTNDKLDQCDNELLHQNLVEDPGSELQSGTSENETHSSTYENGHSGSVGNETCDGVKEQEEKIEASAPSVIDFPERDLVQILQQQTTNPSNENVDLNIIESADEYLDAREEEKDDIFEVEEELSTSSEDEYLSVSDVGDTTYLAENVTTRVAEFSSNEAREVTSPLHPLDAMETESREALTEGENFNEATCQKSPQIMSITVDETVPFDVKVDDEAIVSTLNSSLNDDADQDQELVHSSMSMNVAELGSPPELIPNWEESSENCWANNDEPPLIDKYG